MNIQKFTNNFNFQNIFNDFYFKSNFKIKNYNIFRKNSISQISLVFNNQKFKFKIASYIFGIIKQFFKRKSTFFNKSFGFKEKINFNFFITYDRKVINYINNFIFFLENIKMQKIYKLGLFGFNFKYLKFFFNDIYNFFENNYFVNFYKDYFDFSYNFILDCNINIKNNFLLNLIFNFFKI